MRTQLNINGELKDVEIENGKITIIEPEKKATGWERIKKDNKYCYWCGDDRVDKLREDCSTVDNNLYSLANYFSSEELFKNISCMQTLQRKMFRWQAENDVPIRKSMDKYIICTDGFKLKCEKTYGTEYPFLPCFSSKEKAEECLKLFIEDLQWLFTEFRWRMDG